MSNLLNEIKTIISEHHSDVDVNNINVDEDLIDQGFDSLVRTDILITLGEAFDVELMDEDEDNVASLAKVAAFIEKSKQGESSSPAEERKHLGYDELVQSLKEIGLKSGDTVLVHSGLLKLGSLEQKSAEESLELIYQSFMEVLGTNGTLVVPAFFYEYGRWEESFDIEKTPVSKELGAFSKYVTEKEDAKRSIHPLTALAAVGKNADHITNGECGTSYGVGSAWDRFYELDGKMLFLGVDLGSMTFIHYVEHRVGVPHVYNKYHTTSVLRGGKEVSTPIASSVRFLDFDISYAKNRFTPMFKDAGLVKELKIGNAQSYLLGAKDAFNFLVKELNKDLFCLLNERPQFRAGEIPMSGKAGPARE